MAQQKWSNDTMLDQSLTWVKTTAVKMSVCSTFPTTKVLASATYAIAYTTMATTDFTLGNRDTSGRKVAVAQKANVAVGATKSALHIALYSATTLVYVKSIKGTNETLLIALSPPKCLTMFSTCNNCLLLSTIEPLSLS